MSAEELFETWHARMARIIERMARKRSAGDDALAADLKQEALFAIWRMAMAKTRVSDENHMTPLSKEQATSHEAQTPSHDEHMPSEKLLVRLVKSRMQDYMSRRWNTHSPESRVRLAQAE